MHHAKLLLASLQSNGFDPNDAVTYFADGTLGNGAHRIAAALALNTPVFAKLHEGRGTGWAFNWFVENGFTTEELQRILYTYTHLKADDVVVFVFYAPARTYWDLFEKTIAQAFYVVGRTDVTIDSQLGMYELVHDLYATLEPLSSTGVINRKALLLAMATPLAVRVVVAERRGAVDDVYAVAATTKNSCRDLARDTVAPGSFLSAHAASSKAETLNLARVLLSPNNLRQLSRRRAAGVRTQFGGWLAECREACVRSGIAVDDICIVGSSPLEVIGVRPSTDVDFTLKSHYRRAGYGSGVSHLTPVVDIVTAGYHRSHERPVIPDDELIENPRHHFIFRGFKFANPEIVLEQKHFYRRDKDVRDIELATRLHASAVHVSFDPSVALAGCTETLIRELTVGSSGLVTTRTRRLALPGLRRFRDSLRMNYATVIRLRRSFSLRLRSVVRSIQRRVKAAVEHH